MHLIKPAISRCRDRQTHEIEGRTFSKTKWKRWSAWCGGEGVGQIPSQAGPRPATQQWERRAPFLMRDCVRQRQPSRVIPDLWLVHALISAPSCSDVNSFWGTEMSTRTLEAHYAYWENLILRCDKVLPPLEVKLPKRAQSWALRGSATLMPLPRPDIKGSMCLLQCPLFFAVSRQTLPWLSRALCSRLYFHPI